MANKTSNWDDMLEQNDLTHEEVLEQLEYAQTCGAIEGRVRDVLLAAIEIASEA